ncbi:MAG: hypothetical protein IH987_10040 [Planctomycetes bacterium]|nr:hypothetical protein [Planctomycetota bacterium]
MSFDVDAALTAPTSLVVADGKRLTADGELTCIRLGDPVVQSRRCYSESCGSAFCGKQPVHHIDDVSGGISRSPTCGGPSYRMTVDNLLADKRTTIALCDPQACGQSERQHVCSIWESQATLNLRLY